MASDDNEPPGKWNEKYNPFQELGLTTEDLFPEKVAKVYKALIRTLHSDKVKGKEEKAARVTTSYNFLKHKTAPQLQEAFADINNASSNLPQEDKLDLSNVLVDKTKSEKYRRLFETKLKFAKKTKFKDNFQGYYKQVFEQVIPQPEKDFGYTCEICEEDFIQPDHHDKLVYAPYEEYLLNGGTAGFWEYLEKLFAKELVYWEPPLNNSSGWSAEIAESYFKEWCDWFEMWKNHQEDKLGKLRKLSNNNDPKILKVVTILLSKTDLSVKALCEEVVFCMPKHDDISVVFSDELLLPAFLHVFKGNSFNEIRHQMALSFIQNYTRIAVIFELVGSLISSSRLSVEDRFCQLGEAILKAKSNYRYAHLCFLLGCCDLNYVAKKIETLSEHADVKCLSAYYLIKTNDITRVQKLGQDALAGKKRNSAAIYYLSLFRHYFLEKEEIDNAIQCMEPILPKQKYCKFVQAFAMEYPDYAFNSKHSWAFAEATAEMILVNGLIDKSSSREEQIFNDALQREKKENLMQILIGVMHVLKECKSELYVNILKVTKSKIKSNLDDWLKEGNSDLVLGLVRIPDITNLLKDVLEYKQFLGPTAVKRQPGSMYDASLLALRGVYHYKIKNYPAMAFDMLTASFYSPSSALTANIGKFLTENPLTQEMILKEGSCQWKKLQTYIQNYNGEVYNEQNFNQILLETISCEDRVLSEAFTSRKTGVLDPGILEKDILGREDLIMFDSDDENDSGSKPTETTKDELTEFLETGYRYMDLEVICLGMDETACCVSQAASFFLKAMKATKDTDISQKYACRELVRECCLELLMYALTNLVPIPLSLYALRAYLSLIFQANQEFSSSLRKSKQHSKGWFEKTPFIDEDYLQDDVQLWQINLNKMIVCPILPPKLQLIAEGRLSLTFLLHMEAAMLKGKIKSDLFSRNFPDYLYHAQLFKQLWIGLVDPEETGYEDEIPSLSTIEQLIKALKEMDSDTLLERIATDEQLEKLEARMVEIQELKASLDEIPFVQRLGFVTSREKMITSLADFHGFELAEVETMMNWQFLRRTHDGFLDMQNRSLNFDGVQAFSRFCGVKINLASKTLEFLMEPAVAGDPNRPALFGWVDLMEIFGGKICAASLSFEEQKFPEDGLKYLKVETPYHPFFKVLYQGATTDGKNSKEAVCGTNFLMTLYHMDLLAKIFTTGIEVGANFPFPFRDTENHMLKHLSRQIQQVLKPIGPRKKVQNLQRLETINRFWFSVEQVEREICQTDTTLTFKFGNASAVLKTREMIRNSDGKLEDKEESDESSPETKFVKGFNENLALVEKEFPIIKRVKELAKISECFWMLDSQKDTFCELCPSFAELFSMKLPSIRPYSRCGGRNRKCQCCDWVPAVYHEMKVTLEQKWEYLYEKFNMVVPKNAVEDGKRAAGSRWGQLVVSGQSSTSSAGTKENKGESSKPKVDMGKYDRLEVYRCYGGVSFTPMAVPASGLYFPGQTAYSRGTAMQCMRASGNGASGDGGNRNPPPPPPPKVNLPENNGQLKHIFRNAPNHLSDTPQNRQMLTNVANNGKVLGTDKYGNTWSAQNLPNGKQAWVSHRNGQIQNGGVNETPKTFHPASGLSSPDKPGSK